MVELNYLLSSFIDCSEEDLPEDRMILQPDGTRACVNWELRGKGFSEWRGDSFKELSDEELLKDAYLQAGYGG